MSTTARPAPDLTRNRTVHRTPVTRTAPLDGHVDADVVVIGAGIVGVATAVQLAGRGADVVLLSADPVGGGVTGRSTAKVTALHQLVYADLVQRHGEAAAATYAAASQEAVAWLREAAGDVWQERAAVTVARDGQELAQLRQEAEAATAAGLPVRLEEAVADWPGEVDGLRLEGQGQVDPVALLDRLLDRAPGSIRLHEGTRVTGLRETPGGATARSAGGSASAPAVVIATGMPIFDRSAFFALCEPNASYVVAIAHPDGPPAGGDMMITAGSPSRSLRWATDPTTGAPVLMVGGEGHRTGTGAPTTPRYDRLEAWAREHVDGLGEVVARWSAEDFMSPDRLPWAGPHLRIGGPVHAVTGLSKWGFALGTACATALAERIDGGRVTPFGHLVDPARLPGLRGTGTVVKANAEVAAHLAAGWGRAMGCTLEGDPEEGDGAVGRCGLVPRARSTVDGTTREVSAVCRHLGGIVTWNDGDRTWDCPLHGSRFDADGDVRHGPATRGLA